MFLCIYTCIYIFVYVCNVEVCTILDFNYCLCVLVNLVLSFMQSLPIGVPAKESCSLKWFADWAAILLSQKSRPSIHPLSLISTHFYHTITHTRRQHWRWKTRTGMYVCNLAMSSDVLLLLLFSRIELLSSLRIVDAHFV